MLHLVFRLGAERYALDASRIVEVLPLVNASKGAGAAGGLAMTYRGQMVALVDLAARALGRASAPRLSTRIVVVRGPSGDLVGLIAEQATGIQRIDPDQFTGGARRDSDCAWLGPIAITPQGPIQRIETDPLLCVDAARSAQVAA